MTLSNFKESLKKYAELAVDIGVAVKPGDTVYVQISVDQAQLARLIVAAAYQRGAAEVQVQWFDDVLKRLDMAHMADERLFNIRRLSKVNSIIGLITKPSGLPWFHQIRITWQELIPTALPSIKKRSQKPTNDSWKQSVP